MTTRLRHLRPTTTDRREPRAKRRIKINGQKLLLPREHIHLNSMITSTTAGEFNLFATQLSILAFRIIMTANDAVVQIKPFRHLRRQRLTYLSPEPPSKRDHEERLCFSAFQSPTRGTSLPAKTSALGCAQTRTKYVHSRSLDDPAYFINALSLGIARKDRIVPKNVDFRTFHDCVAISSFGELDGLKKIGIAGARESICMIPS